MSNTKPIERLWEGFAKNVFPGLEPGSPAHEPIRAAFFSGAHSVFSLIEGMGDPRINDAAIEAAANAIRQELAEFVEEARQRSISRN